MTKEFCDRCKKDLAEQGQGEHYSTAFWINGRHTLCKACYSAYVTFWEEARSREKAFMAGLGDGA